jgi:large-conductance mechanosensitive channel
MIPQEKKQEVTNRISQDGAEKTQLELLTEIRDLLSELVKK